MWEGNYQNSIWQEQMAGETSYRLLCSWLHDEMVE
jgi:hypothetical protein